MNRRDIRLAAEDFLKEHHGDLSIPVPIEDILEIKLKIDIEPRIGLHERFGRRGILLSSGRVIIVENNDYEDYLTRYRFTLAHELGHILLHREHVDSVSVDDVAQAFAKYSSLDPKLLDEMERDASYIAGHILVPQAKLLIELEKVRQRIIREKKVDIKGMGSDVRDRVASILASVFEVSENVTRHRLEEERLP
jgi:Zn-dependent peptidase ImmA (M78 family)